MISDIRTAILLKVQEAYSTSMFTYYKDNVPQDFVKPSFFIDIIDIKYNKRINNRYKGKASFDLAYFSDKAISDIKSDCLVVEETLLRLLDYAGTYKVINKDARITDNVLHISFDVNYSEMTTEEPTKIQSVTINMNL